MRNPCKIRDLAKTFTAWRKCCIVIRKIPVETSHQESMRLYLKHIAKRKGFEINDKLRRAIQKSQE